MLFLSYRTVAMSRSAVVQPCSGNAQRRIIWSVYKRESERFGEAHKNSPCVDLPGGGHTKEVFMDLGQSFPIGSVERDLIISPTAGTDGRLRIRAPFPIPFPFPLIICSCSLSLGAAGGCTALAGNIPVDADRALDWEKARRQAALLTQQQQQQKL